MPSYMSPGVYVEEVPSGSAPISGVGTSTAGFIGLVPDEATMPSLPDGSTYTLAPAGEPRLVTNFAEFTRQFGEVSSERGAGALGQAVRGFFLNGGTRCWVARVTSLAAGEGTDPFDVALEAFAGIDEIALVAAPMIPGEGIDAVRIKAIQEKLLTHCETLSDRFAILDAAEEVPSLTAAEINKVRESTYGALYFPWIDITGKGAYVPPSGHVAGIYARVDAARGVHKAPANEVVKGALGLRYRISKAIQDDLNPNSVNALRTFGNSIKVWGARTLKKNDEFTYINIRRLFAYVRESIDEGLQWAVFEPNDSDLWAKISRNVSAFLTNVWSSGALFGNTPEQAFYVKCDEENNPPEVRDLGQVVTEIGLAVTKPAEFVIFRISQRNQSGG
ncbi:MAG: phage tail sheath family protein [Myxococcales bacterium]|nr:phage tail sheath family protein [Myxococcales bacterium]MCB9566029.1 phage tail sheath family protein [Myxococcales bacterium]MCB9702789.1 phage tail sheath family protein [Myxococcales bacterium]